VYSVPADFFNGVQIPLVALEKQKAKIVSIKKRSNRLKIAAAAVIIPFLAIGLYNLTGREYIKGGNSNAKNEVKNLSNEEIVNFLKKNTQVEDGSSTSQNSSINGRELRSSLKKISDKEIQQFLTETGESDEI